MGLHFTTQADDGDMDGIPDEFRLVVELWHEKRIGQSTPTWLNFRLEDLPPNLIPFCSVVNVIEGGKDFIYRFWGTARHAVQGRNLTGKSIYEIYPAELATCALDAFREVIIRAKPIWFSTSVRVDGQQYEFQFLRMPLGDGNENVDRIFSISRNRRSPRELETMVDAGLIRRTP